MDLPLGERVEHGPAVVDAAVGARWVGQGGRLVERDPLGGLYALRANGALLFVGPSERVFVPVTTAG
ncbi:MAG: hypothetical protein ACRDZO_01360 [Egibacteraceae bacterium]